MALYGANPDIYQAKYAYHAKYAPKYTPWQHHGAASTVVSASPAGAGWGGASVERVPANR
jgi:hypothetical protein